MALFQCDVFVIQKSTAFAIPGLPSYQEVSYHRLVSLTSLLPRACRSMKLLASRNAIQSRTPNLIKLSIQSSTPNSFATQAFVCATFTFAFFVYAFLPRSHVRALRHCHSDTVPITNCRHARHRREPLPNFFLFRNFKVPGCRKCRKRATM
jgi:hypothetical protein